MRKAERWQCGKTNTESRSWTWVASSSANPAENETDKGKSTAGEFLHRVQRGHTIEVNLQNLNQFFNTIDPSPFHEKDLDDDLEEFIVSWAKEYPLDEPVKLVVHLQNSHPDSDAQAIIERAVHNY